MNKDKRDMEILNIKTKDNRGRKLQWMVFVRDMNSDEIFLENVFNLNSSVNGEIYEITNKVYDFKEWKKKILSAIRDFWCRVQYEIGISDPFETRKMTKIDVFTQLVMNWEHFINYLWNNKDLIKNDLYEDYKFRQQMYNKKIKE